jgi:hypothetical protein
MTTPSLMVCAEAAVMEMPAKAAVRMNLVYFIGFVFFIEIL